jgi:2-polyprenyl-3-methyl-5-hydroxy-6-metoxy-1,4-benzoquinol methylase
MVDRPRSFRDDSRQRRIPQRRVLSWGDQHPALFAGFDHPFGPVYRAALIDHRIPAIEGLPATTRASARVADVGAGRGTAVLLMAEASPASTVTVIDLHEASLDAAAAKGTDAGITKRITVQQASATDYGGACDLITFFDSLHDMGDPEQVISHARRQLAPDGVVMVVEPMVADNTRDKADTLAARLFYPSSATMCTPSGLASGRTALGNQVPDEAWHELFQDNGFRIFRRAGQTAL